MVTVGQSSFSLFLKKYVELRVCFPFVFSFLSATIKRRDFHWQDNATSGGNILCIGVPGDWHSVSPFR